MLIRLHAWLDQKATGATIALMVLSAWLWQALTTLVHVNNQTVTLETALRRLDSGWYLAIANDGYSGHRWAFFPLYPLTVRGLAALSGLEPTHAGLAISAVSFVAALAIYRRTGGFIGPQVKEGHVPIGTNLGWSLFVFSPASWVFLHPHTESLYLLLLCATLYFWGQKRWHLAALMAGLASTTRNEGALLALTVGLAAGFDRWNQQGSLARSLGRVASCGAISAALYATYPGYQYYQTGDPFSFLHAQSAWRPEMTLLSYCRTFWFGNSWQNSRPGSLVHHAFFYCLAGCAGRFALDQPRNLIWLYVALHVGAMPLSGDLQTSFRHAAVLLPLVLMVGIWLGRIRTRVPSVAVLVMTLVLHHLLLSRALLGRWAY